jgi:uncharacterized protein YbjT (DUF2867 family)
MVKHMVDNYVDKFRIRCVVRKKSKAAHLKGLPVEIINADITQPSLLKAVFADDVNVAFWSTPTAENRAELTKLFLQACIDYGVDFPIIVSILDADRALTQYQQQFNALEQTCKELQGTPVKRQLLDTGKQVLQPIILRCGMFYQNLFGSIAGLIHNETFYYNLGKNDGFLPHVDLDDVGKVASMIAVNPEPHAGKTYNLIGEYHQGNQIATAFTRSTGYPCKYEMVDDDTAVIAFQALGLPDWLAIGNAETVAYYREENGQDIPSDIEGITGTPPTKLATFAKAHLKPLLDAQKK